MRTCKVVLLIVVLVAGFALIASAAPPAYHRKTAREISNELKAKVARDHSWNRYVRQREQEIEESRRNRIYTDHHRRDYRDRDRDRDKHRDRHFRRKDRITFYAPYVYNYYDEDYFSFFFPSGDDYSVRFYDYEDGFDLHFEFTPRVYFHYGRSYERY